MGIYTINPAKAAKDTLPNLEGAIQITWRFPVMLCQRLRPLTWAIRRKGSKNRRRLWSKFSVVVRVLRTVPVPGILGVPQVTWLDGETIGKIRRSDPNYSLCILWEGRIKTIVTRYSGDRFSIKVSPRVFPMIALTANHMWIAQKSSRKMELVHAREGWIIYFA